MPTELKVTIIITIPNTYRKKAHCSALVVKGSVEIEVSIFSKLVKLKSVEPSSDEETKKYHYKKVTTLTLIHIYIDVYNKIYVPCLLLVKLVDSEEVIILSTISVLIELNSGVVVAKVD